MEGILDRELDIVGERYRSFLEFYRENEYRPINSLYQEQGDGFIDGLFEVAPGVLFGPDDTREALLYGSDMYHEQFEQAKVKAQRVLHDKYDWLAEERFESDTHGQNVIVERHVLGHPKSFSRRKRNMTRKRSVCMFYDAMCPASTSLEQRIASGCSVLAAADALEQVGYEVAISFVLAKYSGSNVRGDPTLVLDIPLKDYGERLLPAKVEFALASKSMLFHVGCWWARRFPRTPVNYGPGEGYALSYDKGRLEAMRVYAEKHHGVYVSEDIIEVQLESDPIRVLEHVIEDMGEGRELLAHLRSGSRMDAGMQPEQGKMFSGWDPGAMDDMQAGEERLGEPSLDVVQGDTGSAPGLEDEGRIRPSQGEKPDGSGERQAPSQPRNGGVQDQVTSVTSADATPRPLQANEGAASTDNDSPDNAPATAQANASTTQTGADARGDGHGGQAGGMREGHQVPDTQGEGASEKGTRGGSVDIATGEVDSVTSGENDTNKEDDDDGIESESEGMTMSDKEQEGGLNFAQITKALDDDMADSDPAMPQSAEEFVAMLRRRYILFEQGSYLDMMISQKMARRKEEKGKCGKPNAPLAPPPVNDAPTLDNVQFGAPRNTPFSMTSIPHKKN